MKKLWNKNNELNKKSIKEFDSLLQLTFNLGPKPMTKMITLNYTSPAAHS